MTLTDTATAYAADSELSAPWPLPTSPVVMLGPDPGDYAETIFWHDARQPARPDAELTVLLMTTDPDHPVQLGWWDADSWCLCESGGFAPAGLVVAWAEVEGPELPPNEKGNRPA